MEKPSAPPAYPSGDAHYPMLSDQQQGNLQSAPALAAPPEQTVAPYQNRRLVRVINENTNDTRANSRKATNVVVVMC